MANDSNLGPLSADEIAMVKKHRDDQLKVAGWRQGAQAVLNAFDNNQPDGSLSLEASLRSLRWALVQAANHPKVY